MKEKQPIPSVFVVLIFLFQVVVEISIPRIRALLKDLKTQLIFVLLQEKYCHSFLRRVSCFYVFNCEQYLRLISNSH